MRASRPSWPLAMAARSARRGQRDQQAGALAVEPEVLGAGHGHQHLGDLAREHADRGRVALEVVAEPLVGEVDERQQAAPRDDVGDGGPLRDGQVLAGRVVAAGMQHDDGARGQGLEVGGHAVELDRVLRGGVVGIALDLEPRAAEQRDVVRPGRVADVHRGVRARDAQQLGAEAQRTAAAGRLHGGGVALAAGVIGTHHELQHLGIEARVPDRAEVGLAGLRRDDLRLGALHRGRHRRVALVVLVDADPEVDLQRRGVALEGGADPEDRVIRHACQQLEHSVSPLCVP